MSIGKKDPILFAVSFILGTMKMELIVIDHACRTLCCLRFLFVQLKGVNAFSNVTRLLSNFFKGSSFCLINTLSASGHRFQAMREIEI